MDFNSALILSIGNCFGCGHYFFVDCFWQIFVAMGPVAVIVLYLSMTPSYTLKERLAIAKTACLVAWSAMLLTAIGGLQTLAAIGIAMDAFYVGSGLLLVVVGFRMLRSPDPEIAYSKGDEQEINPLSKGKCRNVGISPFGIPIIAGPGALTGVISSRFEVRGIADFIFCLMAISCAVFLVYLLLVVASRGMKWLTPTILKLSFRLAGLFLVAMGMQLAMNGLRESGLMGVLMAKQEFIIR